MGGRGGAWRASASRDGVQCATEDTRRTRASESQAWMAGVRAAHRRLTAGDAGKTGARGCQAAKCRLWCVGGLARGKVPARPGGVQMGWPTSGAVGIVSPKNTPLCNPLQKDGGRPLAQPASSALGQGECPLSTRGLHPVDKYIGLSACALARLISFSFSISEYFHTRAQASVEHREK